MDVYLIRSHDDSYEFPSILGIFDSKDKVIEVMKSLHINNIKKTDGFVYANDDKFYTVLKAPLNTNVHYAMEIYDEYEVTDIEL